MDKLWDRYSTHENFEKSIMLNQLKIAKDIADGNENTEEMQWYSKVAQELLEDKDGTPLVDEEKLLFISINEILNEL